MSAITETAYYALCDDGPENSDWFTLKMSDGDAVPLFTTEAKALAFRASGTKHCPNRHYTAARCVGCLKGSVPSLCGRPLQSSTGGKSASPANQQCVVRQDAATGHRWGGCSCGAL